MYTNETREFLINLLDSGATTEDILGALLSLDRMKSINISQLSGDLSKIAMSYCDQAQPTDQNHQKIFWKQASEKFSALQKWLDDQAKTLNEEHLS